MLACLREGRSPLVLTERTEHLEELTRQLSSAVPHLICLRGGLRRKELEVLRGRLAAIPEKLHEVMRLSGMTQLYAVFATVEQALAAP